MSLVKDFWVKIMDLAIRIAVMISMVFLMKTLIKEIQWKFTISMAFNISKEIADNQIAQMLLILNLGIFFGLPAAMAIKIKANHNHAKAAYLQPLKASLSPPAPQGNFFHPNNQWSYNQISGPNI